MEEIDLKELFNIFWEKKGTITAIVLVAMIAGAIYTMFFITPTYQASTTLVLVSSNSSEASSQNGSITTTDITLNSNLVSTYSVIVKSETVLNKVIENLGLDDFTVDSLKKCISVSEVEEAEVVKISVTCENAKDAYKIANETANVFIDKAEELYNINNIKVLDKASLPNEPSNINHTKDVLLFTIVGFVIGMGYVFILNMLDNTIKTATDIEKVAKLPVLAVIPAKSLEKKKGGKRK